jgi:hypothetical protein
MKTLRTIALRQPHRLWFLSGLLLNEQLSMSMGTERSGSEADHSFPSIVKIKNDWGYTSPSPYVFMTFCMFFTLVCNASLSVCTPRRYMRVWKYSFSHSEPGLCHFHASAVLFPGKGPRIRPGQEAGWAPLSMWTIRRRE